jgi:TonB-dependent SusC/RagA subfamily outer membrane receptor
MKRKTALARATILLIFFFSISLLSFSQNNFRVSGKVTDETGKPVSGATVTVKGTAIATATTSDGSFVLNIPSGNAVLVVTSIGIVEMEVGVNNRAEIAISTTSNTTSLQDVVVIGYGTQKRKNVTGAVSSFNASNLQERPILRVDQALVGQLAGVRVKQTTGTPGKGFSIQVRGSGSISGGNEPLYVIDGFPLTVNSTNVSNGSFSTGNPLDNINPNDIERIEVLKDAAAAAIYGSRASNGVVIITTKHGRSGKAKISFNIYGGYNETAKKLEMMNL